MIDSDPEMPEVITSDGYLSFTWKTENSQPVGAIPYVCKNQDDGQAAEEFALALESSEQQDVNVATAGDLAETTRALSSTDVENGCVISPSHDRCVLYDDYPLLFRLESLDLSFLAMDTN
jgi:hypothetical protein